MITTELNIIKEINAGNERVFEALFKSHYIGLHSFAKSIVSDSDQAEELVQDIFFKIWERRASLEITTSIKSYLFSSVRNACYNYIKHMKVRAEYSNYAQYSNSKFSHFEAEDKVNYEELETKLKSLVQALPEQCQKIFRMSRFEGKKQKEIAEELGLSVKTVENQMGRALKVMREGLQEYGPLALLIFYFYFYWGLNQVQLS